MDKRAILKKKIGVLMGGRSSEREISLKSGKAILEGLLRKRYNAVGIDAGKDLIHQLEKEAIEVAFIALHGRWGEDGTVQGLLETIGIPYTGSGVLASAIAMDKITMKYILDGLKLPTPPYKVYDEADKGLFPLPFVVKPSREGSTIGISIVKREEDKEDAIKEALRYDKRVIFERYISGDEITVGVVNGKTLPVVMVRPKKGFYDFEAKYTKGMTEYIIPAVISREAERYAEELAILVYRAFDLSGAARIDMIVEDNTPWIIDINTSPGMTEQSLIPMGWGYSGRGFDELLEEILMEASLKS